FFERIRRRLREGRGAREGEPVRAARRPRDDARRPDGGRRLRRAERVRGDRNQRPSGGSEAARSAGGEGQEGGRARPRRAARRRAPRADHARRASQASRPRRAGHARPHRPREILPRQRRRSRRIDGNLSGADGSREVGGSIVSWAIWITGLPGSGKSVLARAAAESLRRLAAHDCHVLELDEVRRTVTPSPTYSDAEREIVYRGMVYTAGVLTHVGVPVIIDATAHRRTWRELARTHIPRFAEV